MPLFLISLSQDPHKELRGKNVLIVRGSLQETARAAGVDESTVAEQLARAREILFEERQKRPPPHLDTKMITAWNGELQYSRYSEGRLDNSLGQNAIATYKQATLYYDANSGKKT